MKAHLFLVPIFFSFTVSIATAQEDARKVKLDTRKTLRLDYKSDSWNKDPKKVETNVLLIRDAGSGRLAKIEVTETGPETGLFVGYYQINFDSGHHEITAEVFVVPSEMLEKPEGLKNVDKLIKDQLILRKPYFLRVESGSIQAISVYDSKEQAFQAYEDFLKSGSGRPIVDRAALEAAKLAQVAEQKRKEFEAQMKAEEERRKIQDDEKAKQAERLKKQKELDATEKANRQARARELANEAMALYRQEKFPEAEAKFEKSAEVDPENQSSYFYYGMTLYRNDKANKAIVILELAKGKDVPEVDRHFYLGLSHLKMKDLDSAYKEFLWVKLSKDERLGGNGAFYAGIVDYQKENYDSAKGMFEYVLDVSKDPKIDQQAETYLEQIANIKLYQEMAKKKFIITANMGLMYDSNILSLATNSALNASGVRAIYGGSVEYRGIYSEKHELSAIVSLSDFYSTDTSLVAVSTLQNADPLTINIKVPYRYKMASYTVAIAPYYEATQLNADAIGSREVIVNSSAVAIDQSFILSEANFLNVTLDLRKDVSLITAAATENQSANKTMIYLTDTHFLDQKRSSAVGVELGYTMNTALGDNQTYNKLDFATSYFAPLTKDWIWNARLSYYNSNYNVHSQGRNDKNIGVAAGVRTTITETLGLSINLGYNTQTSLEAYTYNKYSLATALSWNASF